MKRTFLIVMMLMMAKAYSQDRTIHVYVALCDNEFQGIVPVSPKLGNGKDTRSNLYWGATYGVKSFLQLKTKDWQLVNSIESSNPYILERILFRHMTQDVFILADAYDGERIQECTTAFLKASNQQNEVKIQYETKELCFGGGADLMAYVGHDGLMDFTVNETYQKVERKKKDVIILACYSRDYFSPEIRKAQANPLLWTTHLMAPEAYTLKAAIDGWMAEETGAQIEERAAQAYNAYQKCGIRGARNLLTTGFKD